MGKGGETTTVQQQTYDKKSSRALARIAKKKQKVSNEQWRMYKRNFMDYEIQAAKAREDLLPHITATAQKLYKESLEGIDVEKRADQAGASVASALASERATLPRTMSRYGIDPGSSRFKTGLEETGVKAAELTAGARNQAVERAESENYARLGSSLGMRSYAEGPQADPAGAAQAGYSGAAAAYAPLASRVLESSRTSPSTGFWDFAGSALGSAAGAFAGSKLG